MRFVIVTGMSGAGKSTALKMLEDMEHSEQKKPLTYFNRAKDGAIIKSVTTPILGDNDRIIGLMCINFHMDQPLHEYLATLVPDFKQETGEPFITETFTQNVNDLITNTVVEVRNSVCVHLLPQGSG